MIQPNVRAGFGRAEAEILLAVAGPEGEARLRAEGIDSLLDDPALMRALLRPELINRTPAPLVFYLLVRHALLERGIRDRQIADYTAALLLEFGRMRANPLLAEHMPDTIYLTDVVQEIDRAQGDRKFQLRAHLGNLALWLAGMYPGFISSRTQRKGAPPISYYDELGSAGFRTAATMDTAARYGIGELFGQFSDAFTDVRSALNGLSDTLFFPRAGDPVDRVLREVADRFERRYG